MLHTADGLINGLFLFANNLDIFWLKKKNISVNYMGREQER